MGLKSHRSAEVPISRSEIDLVFVGDDFPVILQSSDGGKPMIKRFKTTPTSNGVSQRSSSSKYLCTTGASRIAFRGLLRFSEPNITRVDNPPNCSMIAPAVFAQLNFEGWK